MQEMILNNQRMTSLEIAEVTGKQHKDVLKAIRNMEDAWERTAGRKFALGSYKDANNQERPCYSLTKTECRKTLAPTYKKNPTRSRHLPAPFILAVIN